MHAGPGPVLNAATLPQQGSVQTAQGEMDGLRWWSDGSQGEWSEVQSPPMHSGSWLHDSDDAPRENSALEKLENCSKGLREQYAGTDKSFFQPLDALTASGAVQASNSEQQRLLELPRNCAREYFEAFDKFYKGGPWEDRTPLGMAYLFCHKPLYFEDANLERCGYIVGKDCCCCCSDWCCNDSCSQEGCCRDGCCGCCCGSHLQPLVSAAYFFGTIPLLPYKMTVDCPCECVPSLGRCPEGCRYSCCENYLPPWDFQAALVEAAVITGAFFVIP
jgi:hypothetical protein